MKEGVHIFFDNSPVFRLHPEADKKGAAVAEARVRRGRLFLCDPEVLFRAQPHGNIKLFCNGIYMAGAENTARRYLDILAGAFMVRALPPWFENLKKRQVKAPKIYVRDNGVLHALLQLETLHELFGHPKLGASWEGFALEQVLAALGTRDAYFWATHAGAELDLLVMVSGQRYGFELKFSDAPSLTRSMRIAIKDLQLQKLFVVYPGAHTYTLGDKAEAVPLRAMEPPDISGLRGRRPWLDGRP